MAVHRRNLGLVFQSYALFPHMTVFENVAFGLRRRGVGTAELGPRVERMLELVRLGPLGARHPRELSGGQQQRVALARALVLEPRVLLLDEPLSNLDALLRDEMRVELKRLQERLGTTMIFVTHDQAEALILSDRVVVMEAGRVEQIGRPEEVYRRPATRVRRAVSRARELPRRHRGGDRSDRHRRHARWRRALGRGRPAVRIGSWTAGERGDTPGEHPPRAPRGGGGRPQPLCRHHRVSRLRGAGAPLRGSARRRSRARDRRTRHDAAAGARISHASCVEPGRRDRAARTCCPPTRGRRGHREARTRLVAAGAGTAAALHRVHPAGGDDGAHELPALCPAGGDHRTASRLATTSSS